MSLRVSKRTAKPDPSPRYSDTPNFKIKRSVSQTITFLNLLKRYPVLHEQYDPADKERVLQRRDAVQALLKDCSAARLGMRDHKSVRCKVNKLKDTFRSALRIYKAKVRPDEPLPVATVPWFEAAQYLDSTGYLRRLTQSRAKKTTNPRPVKKVQEKRAPPRPRAPPPKAKNSPAAKVTRSNTINDYQLGDAQVVLHDIRSGIKIEVDEDYAEDYHRNHKEEPEDDQEEMGQEEEEDLEEEEEEEPHPMVRINSNCYRTRVQSSSRVSARVQSASGDHPQQSVPVPVTVQVPPPPSQQQQQQPQRIGDYFTAFLQYTRLRTQDYSARQKREVINALTSVMNRIDDERDALEAQDYSIQMYNSFNEFGEELAKE